MSEQGQHEDEQSYGQPCPHHPPSGAQGGYPYLTQKPADAIPCPQPSAGAPGYLQRESGTPGYSHPPGYPQPGAGAPGYAGPGMPPGDVVPQAPAGGSVPWFLGLLVLTLVPILSTVVASVAMIVAGLSHRKVPGLRRYNGAKAADWGLTYLLATVLLCGGHVVLLGLFANEDPVESFFPLGIPITTWALVTVFHLVYCVYAGVRAEKRRPIGFSGIPFFSRGLSAGP